jgi:hypothetical protein
MNPELPKVETNLPERHIRDTLEKAYLEGEPSRVNRADGQQPGSPGVFNHEDLAKVGSVGVEAGLTDFERQKDDVKLSDDNDDNSTEDDDSGPMSLVQAAGASRVGSTAVVQTPAVAADNDDIEKEWVSKAKRIVEQTKADPFLQERAVSRLQADYMKKRFNKNIKAPDGDS